MTPEIACPGWAGWKDVTVARPYPKEFRDDVVRVARKREPGVGLDQIAKDFGIHFTTLYWWMKKADLDDGDRPGTAQVDSL